MGVEPAGLSGVATELVYGVDPLSWTPHGWDEKENGHGAPPHPVREYVIETIRAESWRSLSEQRRFATGLL